LFQVLEEIKRLSYLNAEQRLMIQNKLIKRNIEIENHIKHFQVIDVQL